jgi:hypothetical protein
MFSAHSFFSDGQSENSHAISPPMKNLAWIVALFAITAGLTGTIAPDRLLGLRSLISTQGALIVIGAIRLAIGVVLIMAAPGSRVPKTLRIVGIVMMLAAVATPLFGIERTRIVLEWEAAQGPVFMRIVGVLILVIGGLLAFALLPRKGASTIAPGSAHPPH